MIGNNFPVFYSYQSFIRGGEHLGIRARRRPNSLPELTWAVEGLFGAKRHRFRDPDLSDKTRAFFLKELVFRQTSIGTAGDDNLPVYPMGTERDVVLTDDNVERVMTLLKNLKVGALVALMERVPEKRSKGGGGGGGGGGESEMQEPMLFDEENGGRTRLDRRDGQANGGRKWIPLSELQLQYERILERAGRKIVREVWDGGNCSYSGSEHTSGRIGRKNSTDGKAIDKTRG